MKSTMKSKNYQYSTGLSTLMLAMIIAGCATEPVIPAKLDLPPRTVAQIKEAATSTLDAQNRTILIEANPQPAAAPIKTVAPATAAAPGAADVILNFDQLPLPAFINAVYATALKKNISIDPAVMSRKDLVTLRSGKSLTATEAESSARLLLKSYGIAVQDLGGLIRIVPDTSNTGYLPEIKRGRALPDTPLPLRPVFQMVELSVVRNTDVTAYIKPMFGEKIRYTEDSSRNSIMLAGNGDDVQAALEAIQVLDQPLFKGRSSIRISPTSWSAEELAKRLTEILINEGYSVGATTSVGSVQNPITLLPVPGINSLIVFAQSKDVTNHIAEWAAVLDKPAEKSVGRTFFSYQVRNTDAARLAETLQQLLGGTPTKTASSSTPSNITSGVSTPTAAGAQGAGATRSTSNVVVDTATNTILFRATGEDYTDMIRLLRELDRPTRQVLIEVTVAEVTLDDTTKVGVDWIFKAANRSGLHVTSLGGNTGVTGSTSSSSTSGTGSSTSSSSTTPSGLNSGTTLGQISGFVFGQLDGTGNARVVLSALAELTKTNVLSTPQILTRNGETATLKVGDEVPVTTGSQTTSSGSTQTTTQYRSTGTLLRIKPVIHSADQVDIDISQENSVAKAGATPSSNPTVSTRALDTKLTLRHGETYVMGGLISNNSSNADSGIPFLKDIPILGYAFKSNTKTLNRTELIVLITPYIINDASEARAVTDAVRKQLGSWAQDNKTLPSPVIPNTEPPSASQAK